MTRSLQHSLPLMSLSNKFLNYRKRHNIDPMPPDLTPNHQPIPVRVTYRHETKIIPCFMQDQ